jgi:glycerophosphoryl diester phosphodiesterase
LKVVGHRGASKVAPENTMAAFRAARDAGADGVELDVHTTADGELVVIHDHAVERTTNGTGLTFELPWAALSRLDAGSWFSDAFVGERVPRLADVLALDSIEFEVELKGFGADLMMGAVAAVVDAGALDRTEFTSWNTPMLMALKERFPAARIGLFSPHREDWMPDAVFERGIIGAAEFTPADVVHVYAAEITPSIVEQLHRDGRRVHANDAASGDEVRRAIECGADRLSTDDPATAVAIRSSPRLTGEGRPPPSP